MAEMNVLKELQVQNSNGFSSPVPIGVEQYFVSSLRGSTVNNLEEQFILGTDCVISKYTDTEDNKTIYITEKEFYKLDGNNQKPSEYYKLVIKDYEPDQSSYVHFDVVNGVQSLVVENNISGNTLQEGDYIQKQFLYYVKNNIANLVASKEKYVTISNNRKIIKEEITNHLSGN